MANKTLANTADAEVVNWQPRETHGATFAQLSASSVPVTEFSKYTKTECDALVGRAFVIVDVKIQNDLVNGEYVFVACMTEDNVSRYFTTSSIAIKDAVDAMIEQGAAGTANILVPRGLAAKSVPAKDGWVDPKTGTVGTRPAFTTYSFSS